MKSDNTQSNQRGSSPPFQNPEQDFFDWLKKLNSTGQRDEGAPKNQGNRSKENETPIFVTRSVGETQLDNGDDSRWQDDGGVSGEAA